MFGVTPLHFCIILYVNYRLPGEHCGMTDEEREELFVKMKMAHKAAHISATAHPEF